jgi:hypothetical protein
MILTDDEKRMRDGAEGADSSAVIYANFSPGPTARAWPRPARPGWPG